MPPETSKPADQRDAQTAHLEGNEPKSPIPASETATNSEEPAGVAEAKPSPVAPAGQVGVEPQTETPAPTPPPQNSQDSLRNLFAKAKAVIQRKKTKKLEKIITEITRKGKISNDEVEKLLHVSDATATRYLSQLEREGRIKQTGKTGRSVFYTKM